VLTILSKWRKGYTRSKTAYAGWYAKYKASAVASVSELLKSTELEDEPRLKWVRDREAEFYFAEGSECCALHCAPRGQKYGPEGWGDNARDAVDSAIREEERMSLNK